ncbi:MAG: hypothetical protein FWG13_07635 [Leptospirales bacterium]|nr:hypothetical protein [Leptospirales bacterium]
MKKTILLCAICALLGSCATTPAADEVQTLTFPDGSTYVGQVKDGKLNGQGTYTWPNGSKYTGQWEDGKMQGEGTMISSAGTYIGQHEDGLPNGQGTMISSDGKYVGQFKNGKPHGQGILYDLNDGRVIEEGTFVEGLYISK